eukprot:CAMPEP_0204214102 /NCGR_PEP_ID=MMETSP0361-20130328/76482_1 /ASSEMBLY_ACC=CAM_ASM_000343 /TAXON_ID=268821 /ORGANISM="Scrippsiella Hangoei, Strain SHTV-5" /LENGTH=170 /DNA_ID=CAMNT_0051178669 /DNA_START=50 /DNA_END=559 /DNA_ORIENTATION=-
MALSQEFWLQKRRREAEDKQRALEAAGGLPQQPPLLVPAAVATLGLVGQLMAVRPPAAMSSPGSANMIAGMPWVAPRLGGLAGSPVMPCMPSMVVEPPANKKGWNSDDEEIDEFGRKKRRRTSRAAPASASASPAAPAGGGEGGGSSGSRQAALERLHARSRKPPEPAPA